MRIIQQLHVKIKVVAPISVQVEPITHYFLYDRVTSEVRGPAPAFVDFLTFAGFSFELG
jgi:hypothetical protein